MHGVKKIILHHDRTAETPFFKDQTHSVNEGKSNFVTRENQTAVLSESIKSIMTHRFHPPIVHQFEIFYDSSTLRPVQLRSKLRSTSIGVEVNFARLRSTSRG